MQSDPTPGNTPKDGEISPARSYLVIFVCWLAIFAEGYDVGVLGAILPVLSADPVWQLSPLQVGAIGSYTVLGMLAGGLLAGTLSEINARKPLFIACLALFASCMIFSAMAPTPKIIAISRFVAGLGLGGIVPCAAALTTEFSPARSKSFNYGLMYSGYSFGILTAALISRAYVETHGWRTMLMIGAFPLLMLPLFAVALPEPLEWLSNSGQRDRAREMARRWRVAVPQPRRNDGQKPGWREVLATIFARARALETACFWSAGQSLPPTCLPPIISTSLR